MNGKISCLTGPFTRQIFRSHKYLTAVNLDSENSSTDLTSAESTATSLDISFFFLKKKKRFNSLWNRMSHSFDYSSAAMKFNRISIQDRGFDVSQVMRWVEAVFGRVHRTFHGRFLMQPGTRNFAKQVLEIQLSTSSCIFFLCVLVPLCVCVSTSSWRPSLRDEVKPPKIAWAR